MTEPSIGWRSGLAEEDRRAIRTLIAAAKKDDGIAPVGDQVLRELSHDRTRHLVALDGDTVGYLNLTPATGGEPAMAELVVHPRLRVLEQVAATPHEGAELLRVDR